MFVAYYDKCYYSALRDVFAKHGFRIVDARFNYYQSHYFTFFELLLRAIGAKHLSPYLIFVAQKATSGTSVQAISVRA